MKSLIYLMIILSISSCAFKKEEGVKEISTLSSSIDSDLDGIPDELERDQFEKISFNIPRLIPVQISTIEWVAEIDNGSEIKYSRDLYADIEISKKNLIVNTLLNESRGRTFPGYRFKEVYRIFSADDEYKDFVTSVEYLERYENAKTTKVRGNFLINFTAKDFYLFDSVERFDVTLSAFDGRKIVEIDKKTFNTEAHSISGLTNLRVLEKDILTPIYFDFSGDLKNLISDDVEFIIEFKNVIAKINNKSFDVTSIEESVRKRKFGIHYISKNGLKKFYVEAGKTVKDLLSSVFSDYEFKGDSILNIENDYSGGESHKIADLQSVSQKELEQETFKKIISNNLALDNKASAGDEIVIFHQTQRQTLEDSTVYKTQFDSRIQSFDGHSLERLKSEGRFVGFVDNISFETKSDKLIAKILSPQTEQLVFSTRQTREGTWSHHCVPTGCPICKIVKADCWWEQSNKYHCYKTWNEITGLSSVPFISTDLSDYNLDFSQAFIDVNSRVVDIHDRQHNVFELTRSNIQNTDFSINVLNPSSVGSTGIGRVLYQDRCHEKNLEGDFIGTAINHLNRNYHLIIKTREYLDFNSVLSTKEE